MTQQYTKEDAERMLKKLREAIDAYHNVRRANDAIAFGLEKGKVSSKEAKSILDQGRDRATEDEAVAKLRDIYRMLQGENPENIGRSGPDILKNGLGIVYAGVIPIAALIGGTVSLIGYFQYKTAQENRMHAEITGGASGIGWTQMLMIGGVAVGAYYGWKYLKGNKDEMRERWRLATQPSERIGPYREREQRRR